MTTLAPAEYRSAATAATAATAAPPHVGAPDLDPVEPVGEPVQEVVIEPHKGWIGVDWGELLRYRELLYFLVWRDVKVKYKQAILGAAWAVFLPIISMVIYTAAGNAVGLGKFVRSDAPYALYVYAGLLPWQFLAKSLGDGGMSLVNQQNLMAKVYMPRLYLPAASCGAALVDLLISFGIIGFVGLYFYLTAGWVPSWQVVFLPALLLLTWVAALGLALTVSAMTVLYRDLRFIIPFITQFGLWLSGVVIPTDSFGRHEVWFALNPFAGIIAGYRSAILGEPWKPLFLVTSVVMCSLLLAFGVFYFKRVERRFADIA